MRWVAQVALLSAVASGCAQDTHPVACGVGPGRVEVGEGGARLRDLPDHGGTLTIVEGSQGGIHVLVGFRVWDMDLHIDAVYRLVDPLTDEILGSPTEIRLRSALFTHDGTSTVRNPDLVVLDNDTPRVGDFAGRTVRIELEATTPDARACDARTVQLIGAE